MSPTHTAFPPLLGYQDQIGRVEEEPILRTKLQ